MDPDKNLAKSEFMLGYRAVDESVSIYLFHFDIETVVSQEDISGSEGDALVAVDEAMVVGERLHEGCRFLFDTAVIPRLRTKIGGLHSTLIADTISAAQQLDQSMLQSVDFGHRKELRSFCTKKNID
jgi:hypothetical protein